MINPSNENMRPREHKRLTQHNVVSGIALAAYFKNCK